MSVEIKVPPMGESVTEATVAKWFKASGDAVAQDEALCELETDKATMEVFAPAAGWLGQIRVPEGGDVAVGAILGVIEAADGTAAPAPKGEAKVEAARPATPELAQAPSVRRLAAESGVAPEAIAGSGKGGRVTKGDILKAIEGGAAPAPTAAPAPKAAPAPAPTPRPSGPRADEAREQRVRMTRLRRRIAERLKEAQSTAAILTTFNEVDMTALMDARARHRDAFEKKHGVRLGFMSFFVKAAIAALREIPGVNAEIDGEDIVYKNYYHVGVAVSAPQGLVVPVLRDADRMGFAEIEKAIASFGAKARDGRLAAEDLVGGTFTISNGGVFGSLLSTPILNPPQSGILGMHKTQERPMVVNGQVVARPMMYVALSYDHRIIDGREAVTFLVRVKECIEDPSRLLFEI
ncbi:MAG: 2-oxoglutarate dehydrogenase complex dihydrolipoyllysine-residue succinyltransferase [Alphaproteobacteria bacterium]|nr:2-oxoglutarate dehydrogenase complex dihydrolipoyllysine-residue succinyltransferase [Alphaproteobacteria bacterium]